MHATPCGDDDNDDSPTQFPQADWARARCVFAAAAAVAQFTSEYYKLNCTELSALFTDDDGELHCAYLYAGPIYIFLFNYIQLLYTHTYIYRTHRQVQLRCYDFSWARIWSAAQGLVLLYLYVYIYFILNPFVKMLDECIYLLSSCLPNNGPRARACV